MTGCRLPAVLAATFVLIAGCGVPTQREPHEVKLPRHALNTVWPQTSTEQTGQVAQVLCLVRDSRLVQAVRRLDVVPDPQHLLDLLVSGPTPGEQGQGLSTALATTALSLDRPVQSVVTVEVGEAEEGSARSDEVLAYGQIVCTLTSRADISAVAFRRDGQPLQVPRADLTLTSDPLQATDYRSLIGPA